MAMAAAMSSNIASSSSSSPFARLLPNFQSRCRARLHLPTRSLRRRRLWSVGSISTDGLDVIPVNSDDPTDRPPTTNRQESDGGTLASASSPVGGFAFDGGAVGLSASPIDAPFDGGSGGGGGGGGGEELAKVVDRAINAGIILAAGTYAISKLLTVDQDYWHGWTLFEIVRYAPQHNWTAYEEALKTNPVFAKMMISGIVYSLGDWIAQCYEGKPLFEFDRTRMFRSGLVGFTLHGSLSHYYYYLCEDLFPSGDWWVVPAKVAFDQTIWSGIWNSIYFIVLAFMRLESPISVYAEWKATFWQMLMAGWKLWPFAHLITYGVVPVEQRLLWVDCVELLWVTILSTISNEKSEAKISDASSENNSAP